MKTKQTNYNIVDKPYDPRNPNVLDARRLNSEYIVYYAQLRGQERWNFERVSDGEIIASGSLESMLALLNLYPNSRRATGAEDILRYTPYCLTQDACDDDERVFNALDKLLVISKK